MILNVTITLKVRPGSEAHKSMLERINNGEITSEGLVDTIMKDNPEMTPEYGIADFKAKVEIIQ